MFAKPTVYSAPELSLARLGQITLKGEDSVCLLFVSMSVCV